MIIKENIIELKEVNNNLQCSHCGLPCDVQPVIQNDLVFCCSGCSAVYQLLNQNDLCAYYQNDKGLKPEVANNAEFEYLDSNETREKFVIFSQGTTVQFRFLIPGMHCNSCIYLLERLERLLNGVVSSRVDFFNKELLVTVNQSEVKLSALVVLLYQLGYKPDLTLSNQSGIKKKRISNRAIKIGIAGFAFGNIMMLSFPEYLGLSLDKSSLVLKHWFDYISLALSIPVLLYCSTEFFESSWKAIRQKTLNIDLPVMIAVLATFIRSVYEIFFLNQSGYLDSMTGIVFLLLVGRYFQDLTYHSLTFDRDYKSYFPLSARLLKNQHEHETVNITQLKKDDLIELRNGELLPADAIVESKFVTVDYSFITGESVPVALQKEDKIFAGAKISGNPGVFKLLTTTDNSRLVKLWSVEKTKDGADNSLTEKINFYFTLGLIIISVFAFVYQYQVNGIGDAFKALTSVLIVACPCILLLATNFANGHLLRTLKQEGMFVKNKSTITKLNQCQTIVFDKTGTLTDNSHFKIENISNLNGQELSKLALICRQSIHPYSVALSKLFYIPNTSFTVDSYTDIVGKGIQGKIANDVIRIGNAEFLGVDSDLSFPDKGLVHVSINSEYRGYFTLSHDIRKETESILKALKKHDYELYLSSGDSLLNQEIDPNWFDKVMIKQEPEDKVNLIKSLKSEGKVVCMTGDGLNDAPALNEADIAISVADNTSAFFPACDVLIKSDALKDFPKLLQFIKASKWVIIISFAFSLIYNAVGLYFAITAQLSPLFAAILMPSSSMTMLLLTWLLTALIHWHFFKKENLKI
ncbi:MAG: heavy metal translocating P-type ATPase metal-binding domain-containing protein [Bacteroidota bacterium]|nr:heavy metal translocating P-type ATPase metal-binding domain-containing protein [Bacteroidota bacterium]